MSADRTRATIIAIEGCDGTGKETQSKLLKEYLEKKGKNVKLISFPNYESNSSLLVRSFLKGELHNTTPNQRTSMYALDRSLTMNTPEMIEFLSNPENVVICDRYTSTIVYDTVHIEMRDLYNGIKNTKHIEHDILGVPVPDVILMLDLSDDFNDKIIKERLASNDTDIYESDNDFLRSIRSNIRRINSDPHICVDNHIVPVLCNTVNRRYTIEEVSEIIINKLKNLEVL